MSEAWRCPDCAEDVAADATVCPYCGCSAAAGGDGSTAGPSGAPADAIALLRQLAALRDEDVITNEEFEAKKAEILRRL